MGRDFEKSKVLTAISRTDSLRAVYVDAARTVHSDHDDGRVMRAIEN